MFTRILVAYDGSPAATAALGIGIGLAKRLSAELHSVSVQERLPRYAATIGEVQVAKEEAEKYFRTLTKQARDRALLAGVVLETVTSRGREADTILDVAREGRFDLLLAGYRGHGRLVEWVIGSTALSVARLAPCSVLIARPRGASGGDGESFKRILVGLDGSPLGQLALRIALDLAGLFGATVLGVTVREVSPLARAESLADPYADQLQAAAVEHARAAGVTFERIMRGGHAAQTLCEQAREGSADLIVLGATGLEHPWSVTLGGTAMRVATDAPCDVLLVRPPQAALHVRDVMVRGVSSVMPDTPVAEVVELLLRRNVKAIPVVSAAGRVEGIITGGDLLRHGDLGLRLSIQQELDADTLGDRLRGLARGQKLARDLMTRPVHTVEREVDLATAIRLMATRQVKRLPVVDRRGELVGMVSRADILRAIAAMPEPSGEAEGALHHGARTVGDAITTGVPRVGPEAPAEEVLAKLLESPMRRVVVTESDGRALGIISDRDLLARTSPDVRPWLLRALTGGGSGRPSRKAGGAGVNLPLTARDLMAPSLVAVRPEDSIGHAIRLMMQHRVKRLVVVDGEGRLLGLVDRREVLRSLVAPALA